MGECDGEDGTDVKLLDKDKMSGLVAWAKKFCEDVMPDNDKILEYAARFKKSAESSTT